MMEARRDTAIRAYDRARAQRRAAVMAAARHAACELAGALENAAGIRRVAARVLALDARLDPASHPVSGVQCVK